MAHVPPRDRCRGSRVEDGRLCADFGRRAWRVDLWTPCDQPVAGQLIIQLTPGFPDPSRIVTSIVPDGTVVVGAVVVVSGTVDVGGVVVVVGTVVVVVPPVGTVVVVAWLVSLGRVVVAGRDVDAGDDGGVARVLRGCGANGDIKPPYRNAG